MQPAVNSTAAPGTNTQAVSTDAPSEAVRRMQAPEVAPPHGVLPPHLAEDGVIISVTDRYVFVRYSGSETPKATRPSDLGWPKVGEHHG